MTTTTNPERPLRLQVSRTTDDGFLEVTVEPEVPQAPAWILIPPDVPGTVFRTLPSNHYFDGKEGRHGAGQIMRAAAARYIAGDIDEREAERQIGEAVTSWLASISDAP